MVKKQGPTLSLPSGSVGVPPILGKNHGIIDEGLFLACRYPRKEVVCQ